MKKIILNSFFFIAGFTAYSQNNALDFDGMDDQVYFTTHGLTTPDFTIEADVMTKTSDTSPHVFMQFFDATNGRFELRIDGGMLSVLTPNMGLEASSGYTVPVGKYFHMAFVKSVDTSRLYADGREVLKLAGDYVIGSTLKLGRYFAMTTFSFKGQLDELRFWNVAKSPAEVLNYSCSLKGDEASLAGYYDFNQGVAGGNNPNVTTLLDRSATKINGTLGGFDLKGDSSNWVASTTCTSIPTGIEITTYSALPEAYVYPNPATDWLEIKNAKANSMVAIYSSTGQLVLSTSTDGRIELPKNMQAGMYMATVKGENMAKITFVKQ